MEETKRESSESRSLKSFSSLPNDIILNCFARVSRLYYPTLSLVSKSFGRILSSRELYTTRTLIRKTEDILFVCLSPTTSPREQLDPRWFALSLTPKQEKLIPMPSFPYTEKSTVLSTGSEFYIIGGYSKGVRSRRVFHLDYQSHKWRKLRDMRVARKHPAADVIDGKLYVIGGNSDGDLWPWGEVYNPKTQTWKPLQKKTLDLTIQKNVFPSKLVMGGQIFTKSGAELYPWPMHCLVKLENVLYHVYVSDGKLCGVKYAIMGLEELSSNYLVAVANPSGGSRVTVWWKTRMILRRRGHYTKQPESDGGCYYGMCKTNIWCAEISFERDSSDQRLWGVVEWSKHVFYFDGDSDVFLNSATTMPH